MVRYFELVYLYDSIFNLVGLFLFWFKVYIKRKVQQIGF